MKMKKILSNVLACSAAVACLGMFSACETSHPKVEMQLSFNEKTYTLEYKLYRKVAPATTSHFLALVDAGFYNEMIIHSYENSKMYTGAYSYDANEEYGLKYEDYYTVAQGIANFPHTVWEDAQKTIPTYTLFGEFSNNNFKVENGAKKEEFGSLTMYYTNKGDISHRVTAQHPEEEKGGSRDYADNCATSMFYISLSTSAKSNAGYCTFATLEEDSVQILKNLQSAINAYIEDNYDDEGDFVEDVEMVVDTDDRYVANNENKAEYHVPKKTIKVNYVKTLKY